MKVKYKIVPEMVYTYLDGYDPVGKYRLYRKVGFFSTWEYRGYYNSPEKAKAEIEDDYKRYSILMEKVKSRERDNKKHLSQKVIYKDMP